MRAFVQTECRCSWLTAPQRRCLACCDRPAAEAHSSDKPSCLAGLLSPADLIEDSTVIWCPHGLYAVFPKQVCLFQALLFCIVYGIIQQQQSLSSDYCVYPHVIELHFPDTHL